MLIARGLIIILVMQIFFNQQSLAMEIMENDFEKISNRLFCLSEILSSKDSSSIYDAVNEQCKILYHKSKISTLVNLFKPNIRNRFDIFNNLSANIIQQEIVPWLTYRDAYALRAVNRNLYQLVNGVLDQSNCVQWVTEQNHHKILISPYQEKITFLITAGLDWDLIISTLQNIQFNNLRALYVSVPGKSKIDPDLRLNDHKLEELIISIINHKDHLENLGLLFYDAKLTLVSISNLVDGISQLTKLKYLSIVFDGSEIEVAKFFVNCIMCTNLPLTYFDFSCFVMNSEVFNLLAQELPKFKTLEYLGLMITEDLYKYKFIDLCEALNNMFNFKGVRFNCNSKKIDLKLLSEAHAAIRKSIKENIIVKFYRHM